MATVEAAVKRPTLTLFPRKQVTLRAAEILIGGSVFLVLLQFALGFNLFEPRLWSVYQRNFWNGTLRTIA